MSDGDVDATLDAGTTDASAEGSSIGVYESGTCPDGGTTTITGTVYDPAGLNPIYNVAVYVPGAPLPVFTSGASLDACSALYPSQLLGTNTNTSGYFSISNAPYGTGVPLVIQVGKWRRVYTLPAVTACTANDAASLLGASLELPGDSSEGDMPDIAISTGGADTLECLPIRMGISASEYTPGAGAGGHIHIFTGGAAGEPTQGAVTSPASPQAYANLWDSALDLEKNDVVLFSCEGAPTAYLGESDGPTSLMTYVNHGGRVFASHYHFAWFTETDTNPANPFVALSPPLAMWSNLTNDAILNDTVSYPASIVTTLSGGSPFPEGASFKDWLGGVDALDPNGDLDIYYARDNAYVGAANTSSQSWAELDASVTSATTQFFSFDAPIGVSTAAPVGRIVYSDLHVSGGPGVQAEPAVAADYAQAGLDIVPTGCATRVLTPQEKALEFMLFDLSSCLVPTGSAPQWPPQGPSDASTGAD